VSVGGRRLEEAVFDEGIVACAGEDDMVQKRDAEDFGALAKAGGDLAVLGGWVETA